MKKIFLSVALLILHLLVPRGQAVACDFCLLSQGISPLDTLKGTGIRINERHTVLDRVYRGTDKIANPGAKEEYWTTEFIGFYGITEAATILAVVPLKKTSMKGELMVNPDGTVMADPAMRGDASGLGDVALLGRYAFYKNEDAETTTIVAGLVGIKFATGKTDRKTVDGAEFLDSHLQMGTGSTDYLVGLSFNRSLQRFSIAANLFGTITTEGKFGYTKHQFGNMLNYDVTAKYRIAPSQFSPREPQLFAALGVNGELRAREKEDGVTVPDSGGNTVYLSPGAQLVLAPHWVIELSYQRAVYHHLYGTQLGETYKAVGGVTYLF